MNTKATKIATKKKASAKKSGIKTIEAGEVLFHDKDSAESLYIIQSGQLRLYKPKGKGFIDLAILRSGEVLGEMAYFDEKSRRRSCSAAAMVKTEVVEISFNAFAKTIEGLNPWFKTIINTLADRLRKTNDKVKELEGNSVGYGTGGKTAGYIFLQNTDIIKILSTMYLVLKNHGEKKESHYEIHMKRLKYYLYDVYAIPEIKFEEFLNLLKEADLLKLGKDEDGFPKIIQCYNPEDLRNILVFFNTQRALDETKKLQMSKECTIFLKFILSWLHRTGASGPRVEADISDIVSEIKAANLRISEESLKDAVVAGLCEDIIVGNENNLTSIINYEKLKNLYPAIVLKLAIEDLNKAKAADGNSAYS